MALYARPGTSQAWDDYPDRDRALMDAKTSHRFHMAGGTLFYIVAGRTAR